MQDTMLRISDFINPENIFLGIALKSKEDILHFIADKCQENGIVTNADVLFQGLVKREESMSTGVGHSMAFPHTTTPESNQAAVLVINLTSPVPFDSIDDKPVDTIFAIIIPESNQTQHLQILARISRLCRKPDFMQSIRQATDPEKLKNTITEFEDEVTNDLYQNKD